MRIALLSGAEKNSGDFLIVQRSKLLLEKFIDSCEIVEFPRNVALDSRLDEINSCDAVVFAGGPGYVPDMYPGRFPLVDDISEIEPPLFALGMGGFTPTPSIEGISFSSKSRILLERISSDGFGLGCRDRLTERLLNINGYKNTVFTGCPAWHDLEKVGYDRLLKMPKRDEIRSIAVSDPAILSNIEAPKFLIRELKSAFPDARIKLVFHRGWKEDSFTSSALACAQASLAAWAERNDVEPVDISYSYEGFEEYSRCDLHVGYRVHAHLYTVSQRLPSYLIEEDGRGYGANDALGCVSHITLDRPGLMTRAVSKLLSKSGIRSGLSRAALKDSASKMVAHIVEEIERGYPESNFACRASNEAFIHMKEHVSGLNDRLSAGKEGEKHSGSRRV